MCSMGSLKAKPYGRFFSDFSAFLLVLDDGS